MAEVLLKLKDDEETGELSVSYSFNPPPISTDEDDEDMTTLSQDYGMWFLEMLLERPLEDSDFDQFPNVH